MISGINSHSRRLGVVGPQKMTEEDVEIFHYLLGKMNSQTVIKWNDDGIGISNVLNKISTKIGKKIGEFIDYNIHLFPGENVKTGASKIKINKIDLYIDNASGDIFAGKKPPYMFWSTVNKKITKLLDTLKSNFDNPETVEKHYQQMHLISTKTSKPTN